MIKTVADRKAGKIKMYNRSGTITVYDHPFYGERSKPFTSIEDYDNILSKDWGKEKNRYRFTDIEINPNDRPGMHYPGYIRKEWEEDMGQVPPNPCVRRKNTLYVSKPLDKIEISDFIKGFGDEELLDRAVRNLDRIEEIESNKSSILKPLKEIKEPKVLEGGLSQWKEHSSIKESMEDLSRSTLKDLDGQFADLSKENVMIQTELLNRDDIPKDKWIRVRDKGVKINQSNLTILPWKNIGKQIERKPLSDGSQIVGIIASGFILLTLLPSLKLIGLLLAIPFICVLWIIIINGEKG